MISIIGHSGCGKSTLLNLIAGLPTITERAIALGDAYVTGAGAGSGRGVPEPLAAALAHRSTTNVNLAVAKGVGHAQEQGRAA